MKRLVILTVIVVTMITSVTEAKTREYAGGLITISTHTQSYRTRPWTMGGRKDAYSRRGYSYGGYYNSGRYHDGYGYRSSGTTYIDAKEGIYVRRDYTFRDILFGGGDDQINQTIDISRETRERETGELKMSIQEMDEWVKKIKATQEKKEQLSESEKLRQEVEQLKLELEKARLEKELKMLQPNNPNK